MRDNIVNHKGVNHKGVNYDAKTQLQAVCVFWPMLITDSGNG